MTSAQVVETSVNVTLNSPSQDYTHPDDRTPLSYEMLISNRFLSKVAVTANKSYLGPKKCR